MSSFGIPARNSVGLGLGGSVSLRPAFSWSPSALFPGSVLGLWYDPSDFSTLFQDAAGTVPVTAVDQPVGKILDKSGQGNHATQSTAEKRPTLKVSTTGRYYLLFDGTASTMVTSAINLTTTDSISIVMGIRKSSDAARGTLLEFGAAVFTQIFRVEAPTGADSTNYMFGTVGSGAQGGAISEAYPAPSLVVLTGLGVISADQSILRVNGAQVATSAADQGTGNYGNYPLYIGARSGSSNFFNGQMYELIICGTALTTSQIASAENYCNQNTGAY